MASTITIEDAGADVPWFVMVHGMSQDHRVFDKQVEYFSSQFRVLLIDLPGHGLAAGHGGPYGHLEFANHVHHAMREHNVSPAHYWGTHTGAAAGLLTAFRGPDRFSSLILEGPVMPGQNIAVVISEMSRARQIAASEGIAAAIQSWWENACWFDTMRANPTECRAAQHYTIVSEFGGRPWTDQLPVAFLEDTTQGLSKLSVPTLIYNGAADHPEFLVMAERIAALIPNARRSIVADAGGFPAWEQPDRTNKLVADFISAHQPPTNEARQTP